MRVEGKFKPSEVQSIEEFTKAFESTLFELSIIKLSNGSIHVKNTDGDMLFCATRKEGINCVRGWLFGMLQGAYAAIKGGLTDVDFDKKK